MSLTITANLKDITGANNIGSAIFTLVGFGNSMPTSAGAVLSTRGLTAPADGSGAISQTIVGNDVISPANTSYVVAIYSNTGAFIAKQRYSLTGAGTINLSTLTPLS